MAQHYNPPYNLVNRQSFVALHSGAYRIGAMDTGERINALMVALGLNQTELARRVGVKQPSISALIKNGGNSRHMDQIASVLGTSSAYLRGEIDDPSRGAASLPSKEVYSELYGVHFLPEMDLALGQGSGLVVNETEEVLGWVPFPRAWLQAISTGALDHLFLARGDGDSMEPTIKDGELVLIDKAQREVDRPDRIWAIIYGGHGMIKRLRRQPDGLFSILNDNPVVPGYPPAAADQLYIVGRVIWAGKRM